MVTEDILESIFRDATFFSAREEEIGINRKSYHQMKH